MIQKKNVKKKYIEYGADSLPKLSVFTQHKISILLVYHILNSYSIILLRLCFGKNDYALNENYVYMYVALKI